MAFDPKTESRNYYLAVGALHHAYTELEHELTCLIRNVITQGRESLVGYRVAVAVLGGMRMSPLKDTINRLLRAIGADAARKQAVADTFAHLGNIQFLRDRLAHNFTRPDGDRPGIWINDDYAAVREVNKNRTLEFPVTLVTAAAADLAAMKNFLDPLFNDYVTLPHDYDRTLFDPNAMPTWRYKPSLLTQHRQQ